MEVEEHISPEKERILAMDEYILLMHQRIPDAGEHIFTQSWSEVVYNLTIIKRHPIIMECLFSSI
ncbi:hypothetical protein [Thalassobacillus pellis]|uniref:hypothetical protein n=1 Tax=Thalassobacillus pellis TaxID=748008 RepID=UPI0019620BC1|nr:hypothetical protein [Thalassobacillus pellis]MBM7554007.1 hypothetical protein [Thalassobacillus pellis]